MFNEMQASFEPGYMLPLGESAEYFWCYRNYILIYQYALFSSTISVRWKYC